MHIYYKHGYDPLVYFDLYVIIKFHVSNNIRAMSF